MPTRHCASGSGKSTIESMRYLLPLCIGLAMAMVSCSSSQPVAMRNEVSKVDQPAESEPGTIWVKASGYGRDEVSAVHDAQMAAVRHLLFQGIPGTPWNLPMVPDESVSKRDHAEFYERFLDQKGYRDFIMSSSSTPLTKVEGGKRLDSTIKLNVQGIRTYLEKNDIIRKFGL